MLTRRQFLGETGMASAAVVGMAVSGEGAERGGGGPSGSVAKPRASGLEKRLRKEIDKIRMVDMHEHLWPPHMLAEMKSTDFARLFACYAGLDLLSAGMSQADFTEVRDPECKLTTKERWEKIKPWYAKTWNTAFCEPIRLALRDLYGVDDVTDKTYDLISSKMTSVPRDTWIRTVFDKAGVETAQQNNTAGHPVLPRKRYPDIFLDDLVDWFTYVDRNHVDPIAHDSGVSIGCLADHLKAVDWYFDKFADETTAFKIIRAYDRTLEVDDVPQSDADPLYARFLKGEKLPANEQKAVEDFLIRYCVQKSGEHGLPVKIHAGIPINNGRIALFLPVITANPQVKFDVFHIGWPYAEELTQIVKFQPNVWADFCWAWMMNPVSARRYLSEMLECVPCSKIHGFGGDVNYVEETYGHAMIAKREITRVLAEKVEEGRFTEDYVLELARLILRDNAMEHFKVAEKQALSRKRGVDRV